MEISLSRLLRLSPNVGIADGFSANLIGYLVWNIALCVDLCRVVGHGF